ncbi:hypothetical protein QCA50_003271 [Cerrena zonata]|uniref:C3H1-type domain-containing protein n=1 Tax=Cerrena zonata TaxID=2478898 RepID=A0AAW0GW10_9APHY
MPRKRCHWYDQYGHPRQHVSGTLGCTDPKRCSYAHPNDSDWDVARKSGPPPPGYTISAPHSHRQSRPSPLHSSPGELLASRIAPPRVSREPGELDGSERRSENSPTLSSISLNFNEPPRPGDS